MPTDAAAGAMNVQPPPDRWGHRETEMTVTQMRPNMDHWQERSDLAAAFRWTARMNMHEGVANHFSLAINDDGTQFLMNPNQAHFSRIKASDLLMIDANDPETLKGPNAPDPTASAPTRAA